MHDIICPQCGESFIARDVAFDFSDYVLPLLSDALATIQNLESQYAFKFPYLIDEEGIILMKKAGVNKVLLETEDPLGPGTDRSKYHSFELSNKDVFDYIIDRNGLEKSDFSSIMDSLNESMAKNRQIPNDYKAIEVIERLFNKWFGAKGESGIRGFDIASKSAGGLIEILRYIYNNQRKSVTIWARMYCSKMNDRDDGYYVPDIMFILNNNGSMDRRKKSCRHCGHEFPDEFGYYKMIPVTMLGSAYSAKTSFMLSLLWCTRNRPPFNRASKHFKIRTLKNDKDLGAFIANISKYERGEPPDKTVFVDTPILSFLVNDVIYTFVDWPGEAFISDVKERAKEREDFVYNNRRIIRKSRHFICSLDPSQVKPELAENYEEENCFDEASLLERFNEHIKLAPSKYLRSVIILANKFDLYISDENARELNRLIGNLTESSIYKDNGEWDKDAWKSITGETLSFLRTKVNAFVTSLCTEYAKHNICFIPAAPYGKTLSREGSGSGGIMRSQLGQGATDGIGGIGGTVGTGGTGSQGYPGAAGYTGGTGGTGYSGYQGATGYPGAPGAPGAQGSPGSQGYPGATGNTGGTGYLDYQGGTGYPGAPGAPGSPVANRATKLGYMNGLAFLHILKCDGVIKAGSQSD